MVKVKWLVSRAEGRPGVWVALVHPSPTARRRNIVNATRLSDGERWLMAEAELDQLLVNGHVSEFRELRDALAYLSQKR